MSGDTAGGRPGPEEGRKRQRQLTRARVGWPRALRELKDLLYEVYLAAGAPSLDEIAQLIVADDGLAGAPSRDTVRRVISDASIPPSQTDVVTVAMVLACRAVWDVPDLAARVRDLWVQARMAQGAGRPIGDLRGDVRLVLDGGLGVHPALDTDGARDQFGILPTYLPREHDAGLKTVVDAAIAGRSGIAVLIGGSSTGKTRALWEAVSKLPDGWRLWHPLSPTAPAAALAALPDIAPKTVVWLNEAQNYLVPDPLGEQVAAGLRELPNDPSRAPILILGTLWLEHWDTLTSRTTPDRHAGARELLGGHKIDVPDAFTPADLAALNATRDADPRLTHAAQRGTQITQYLAGVPYLIDRFKGAQGVTLALIHAAMAPGAWAPAPIFRWTGSPTLPADTSPTPRTSPSKTTGCPRHSPTPRHRATASPASSPPSTRAEPAISAPTSRQRPAHRALSPQPARTALSAGRLPRAARPASPHRRDPARRLLDRGRPPRAPRRPDRTR
ncbi:hypothetical protein AB0D30_40175 [Streptomyces sp. NPDC048409]|uniref:hypothetical protein n=1 Tax=Streptomyces sp. NPDC048409 TaxID=3154723 RepID=UPI00341A4CAA